MNRPFCPMCGARVAATHRFCAHCGAELHAADSISLPQAESPRAESPHAQSPQSESHPVEVRELLSSVPTEDEGTGRRRILMAVGMVLLIVASGVGGYRWFRPSTMTPAADGTDQVVDVPQPTANPEAAHSDAHWTIVADVTRATADVDAVLGKPDGRMAIIAPGGALAIAYAADMPFYNGEGADVRLDGPSTDPTPYTIFARGGSQEQWLRFDVNRKGFPKGFALHDFGHHQLEQARQILIRNYGSRNLYVDAVTPLHSEPEAYETADHDRGRDPH